MISGNKKQHDNKEIGMSGVGSSGGLTGGGDNVFDEIDAICRARGKNPMQGANDESENTLNQLLKEMDGYVKNNEENLKIHEI